MSPTSASSTVTHPPSGTKRALDDDGGDLMRDDPPALERQSHVSATTSTVTVRSEPSVAPSAKTAVMNSHAAANSTTNFRNVSACNRCRNRKNRCDQKLPRCTGCAKANVKCVGFDPVSKRQIPRSYVYYLETRVKSLEALLQTNGIACPPPSDDFSISETIKPGINVPYPPEDDDIKPLRRHVSGSIDEGDMASALNDQDDNDDEQMMDPALHDDGSYGDPPRVRRAANAGATASASLSKDNRSSHHNGAIPFSRVVFAAVRSSVPQSGSEKSLPQSATRAPQAAANSAGGSSSFFALHTKSTVDPAPFPEKAIGQRLVDLYFEYTNPQLPILHRPEFNALFERVYATEASQRTPRELYLMNMVFAIGSGIIMDSSTDQSIPTMESALDGSDAQNRKRMRVTSRQYQPEEYHASAIVHLDSFLGTSPAAEGVGGGLEELQAVLLLAALALLRPFAPGLWYIIGVAVRLAIDLGLHCEDNDVDLDRQAYGHLQKGGSRSKGRRQWTRDLRRRLWWSTFSLDRLVSTCVGRPVGMTEQVVTTAFPSLLDDKYVSPSGFLRPPREIEGPSYKVIARHYFRLRLLQSEILQVLQHRQAEQARIEQITADGGWTKFDHYIRTDLPSPFLSGFHSFRDWRFDVDRRLWEWKESAPKQHDTGVAFTPLFLELNYWQAVILLYRQSLAVPEPLAEEMSPAAGDMASPNTAEPEAKEDEQMVFMKVAQAGQTVLKIYRQLHRLKLVNYTFLSTHHLFMSGISFLYAIWHSELVRSQVTLDDVDFTVLIATSVLTDLIEKCPPAEACRDAFVRMSKATISMCMSTTGFGTQSTLGSQPLNSPGGYFSGHAVGRRERTTFTSSYGVPMPKFDMNLKDLFSDEEIANRPFNLGINLRDPVFGPSGIGPYKLPIPPDAVSSTSMELEPTPQRMPTASISPELAYHVPYQRQQPQPQPQPPAPAPAAEGLGGTLAPEAMNLFQPLDNLDAVFASDDSNDQSFWSQMTTLPNSNDFDLGFGTGGYDNTWEEGVNLDLFDGLFFGNASAANGGQGHAPDAGSGKEPASEAET